MIRCASVEQERLNLSTKKKKKGLDKDLNAVLYGNKGSQWPVADLCRHVCMLSVGEQARRGKI